LRWRRIQSRFEIVVEQLRRLSLITSFCRRLNIKLAKPTKPHISPRRRIAERLRTQRFAE
jgi:hypothetical protein